VVRKVPSKEEAAAKAKAAPKKINLLDLKRTTNIGIKMSKLKVGWVLRVAQSGACGPATWLQCWT
jgi:hypothetical protein